MYEIGRLCVKLAGRDAGKYCVVVEEEKDGKVLVDGETRRRLVNVKHLEPTTKVLKVSKGASTADVTKVFKSELKIEIKESKPKKTGEKPVKQKIKKEKAPKQEKTVKKTVKKEEKSAKKETKVEKEVKDELAGNKKQD